MIPGAQTANHKQKFAILLICLEMQQYSGGHEAHHISILKYGSRFRLVQGFGHHYTLETELNRLPWLSTQDIRTVIQALIDFQDCDPLSEDFSEDYFNEIKQKMKLAIGFEMKLKPKNELKIIKQERKNELVLSAVINLNFKRFVDFAKEIVEYMNFMIDEFTKAGLEEKLYAAGKIPKDEELLQAIQDIWENTPAKFSMPWKGCV